MGARALLPLFRITAWGTIAVHRAGNPVARPSLPDGHNRSRCGRRDKTNTACYRGAASRTCLAPAAISRGLSADSCVILPAMQFNPNVHARARARARRRPNVLQCNAASYPALGIFAATLLLGLQSSCNSELTDRPVQPFDRTD